MFDLRINMDFNIVMKRENKYKNKNTIFCQANCMLGFSKRRHSGSEGHAKHYGAKPVPWLAICNFGKE